MVLVLMGCIIFGVFAIQALSAFAAADFSFRRRHDDFNVDGEFAGAGGSLR